MLLLHAFIEIFIHQQILLVNSLRSAAAPCIFFNMPNNSAAGRFKFSYTEEIGSRGRGDKITLPVWVGAWVGRSQRGGGGVVPGGSGDGHVQWWRRVVGIIGG
jgi:hypothetical protein